MNFLDSVVWNIARQSVLLHDSLSCGKFNVDYPFPRNRVGFEHVGSAYIDERMRQIDVDILKNETLKSTNDDYLRYSFKMVKRAIIKWKKSLKISNG